MSQAPFVIACLGFEGILNLIDTTETEFRETLARSATEMVVIEDGEDRFIVAVESVDTAMKKRVIPAFTPEALEAINQP